MEKVDAGRAEQKSENRVLNKFTFLATRKKKTLLAQHSLPALPQNRPS